MKKILALALALIMALSCAAFASAEGEVTLDVIICEYGNNTRNWFLGTGMNGTNFVDLFQAANPDIKLTARSIMNGWRYSGLALARCPITWRIRSA